MKNLPTITIATVTLNAAKDLESTILSVIDQSYQNIEYILIDGGSTDETVAIIQKYKHRINYWISEPDRGIFDAMNKAWAVARKDSYILFLGSGDKIYSLPDSTELSSSNLAIYGEVQMEHSKIFYSDYSGLLRFNNTIHHQSVLIHKSLSPEPPFDINYKVYSDYDFNARLWLSGVKFNRSNTFKSYALPGGLSSTIHHQEWLTIVKKNFGFYWSIVALVYSYFYIPISNILPRKTKKLFSPIKFLLR